MKVDIRDGPALGAVSPEAIEGYLENTGWQRKPEARELYSSWFKVAGTEEIELLAPTRKSAADYKARMADLLRDLEQAEERSQLLIFEDLLTADADVLRISLRGPSYRSSLLSVDPAIEIIRAAKELLLAAACSFVKAEPFFSSKRPKPAMDFLRQVRLGVSEHGSVNLKFFVDVPAAKVFPFEEHVPFARGTMLMLQSALDFACAAQAHRSPIEGSNLLEAGIRAGLSANLCDALASMCFDLSDDHAVDLTISYASALPKRSGRSGTWRFRPSQKDFLQALGQQLRESGVDDDFHLIGFVHAIKEPWRDDEYAVIVLAWIRERVTRVNIRLDEDQGLLAVQAFQQRVPVECYGRLLERKATYSLDRPHDLKLYSYSDDPALDPLRKPPAAETAEPGLFETGKEKRRRH